jgi:hypothetical protein
MERSGVEQNFKTNPIETRGGDNIWTDMRGVIFLGNATGYYLQLPLFRKRRHKFVKSLDVNFDQFLEKTKSIMLNQHH